MTERLSILEDRVTALERVAQPDLTKLIASVADTVARLVERDPHQFSPRPCQTCAAVSAILGRDFGCAARVRR